MSDNDARDPAEAFTDVGEMKPQKEVFSGEGDPEPAEVAPPPCPTSQDSDEDAGGEKRAVANSIFQACTAYRQKIHTFRRSSHQTVAARRLAPDCRSPQEAR
ncbi:hypothetical protein MRX96_033378 [Rhipicephalus microplus]